jgi:hypothetical protein
MKNTFSTDFSPKFERTTPELPRDVSEYMSRDLSPQDIINLCASDARPDQNNEFWIRRWNKDFNFLIDSDFYNKDDAKNRYLQLFAAISKGAEKMANSVILEFGDFGKYLNKEYKDSLYKFFYDNILNLLNQLKEKKDKDVLIDQRFGGVNLKNFKQYIPEFIRHDRHFYDDYWGDILGQLPIIVIKINKDLKLFKLKKRVKYSRRLYSTGGSPTGSPRLPTIESPSYLQIGSPSGSPRLPTIKSPRLPTIESPAGSPRLPAGSPRLPTIVHPIALPPIRQVGSPVLHPIRQFGTPEESPTILHN